MNIDLKSSNKISYFDRLQINIEFDVNLFVYDSDFNGCRHRKNGQMVMRERPTFIKVYIG